MQDFSEIGGHHFISTIEICYLQLYIGKLVSGKRVHRIGLFKVIIAAFEGIYISPTSNFDTIILGKNKSWDDDEKQYDDVILHDVLKMKGATAMSPLSKEILKIRNLLLLRT